MTARAAVLQLATMVLVGFAMSAHAASINDFNHRGGDVHDPYPYVGVPLLSGFALAYGSQKECGFLGLSCSVNAVDKRMREMEIMPGAECQGGLRLDNDWSHGACHERLNFVGRSDRGSGDGRRS